MPSPKGAWKYVDLSPDMAVANQSEIVIKAAPCDGVIKQVRVAINTTLATGGGTLAVAKGSVNILKETNVDLQADLANATSELVDLSETEQDLKVTEGDLLKATWTLTTNAVTNAALCEIAIEPAEW